MCGIAGWAGRDPAAPAPDDVVARLRGLSAALAHRGPDGHGLAAGAELPGAAIAHRRLAIVDPTPAGAQPFASPSGRYLLTYNGEVYNAPALRHALSIPPASSDTAVIAALADACGFDFCNDLEGIFAIGLWDRAERRLMLARDGLGVKPLFLREGDAGLWFASELGPMRAALTHLPWTVDPQSLHDYLGANCVPAPATIWREARRVEPGERFIWQAGDIRRDRFWTIPDGAPDARESTTAAAERLDALLDDVHRGQTLSDVPVAVFLSAGADSATVLQRAAAALGRAPDCYTLAWPGHPDFDETPDARATAALFSAALHAVPFDEAAVPDQLPAMAAAWGEPYADSSAVAAWQMCRAVGPREKVALGGDGGDETFGGYATYRAHALAESPAGRALAAAAPMLSRALAALPAGLSRPGFRFKLSRYLAAAGVAPADRHFLWKAIHTHAGALALYTPEWRAGLAGQIPDDPIRHVRAAFARVHAGAGPVTRAMLADTARYLPDDLLPKVDIAGMAHGLEVRVPLLDRRLVSLTAGLPDSSKTAFRGPSKRLLRDVGRRHGLGPVFDRPKLGFSVPIARWFADKRGPLPALLRDAMASRGMVTLGAVDPAAARAILDRHQARKEDASRPLYNLLMLALWTATVPDPPRA